MKPPRLSLAICNTPSITPVPAVIRTRKTSITIRVAMEFHVCCTMVKMMQPKNNECKNVSILSERINWKA